MSLCESYATDSCSSLFSLSNVIRASRFDCHHRLSLLLTNLKHKSSERKCKTIKVLSDTYCRKITLKHIRRFRVLSVAALMFILGAAVHSGQCSSECSYIVFSFTCPNAQHQVVLHRRFDVSGLLWAVCKSRHRTGPRLHKLTACQTPPQDVIFSSVKLWESVQSFFFFLNLSEYFMIAFGDLKCEYNRVEDADLVLLHFYSLFFTHCDLIHSFEALAIIILATLY